MITPDLRRAHWRKSSHSDGGDTNCVVVAVNLDEVVPVRDSKNPAGPALLLSTTAWSAFIHDIRKADR
ncbi:DUF397 domain-containing protein [Streptomyces sp. NBC_00102]|nr:DUF397 domain-containing protein [Streptomyces sp. NBC_00102]